MASSRKIQFDELLTWLKSDDPALRIKALRNLRSHRSKRARKAMLEALNDESTYIRCIAMVELVSQRIMEASVAARRFISDPDGHIRYTAAYALGDLDPTSGPILLSILDDPFERVRSMACISLGNIDYKPAASALRQLVSDPDPNVRASACWALGEMEDMVSENTLLRALTDDDINVRYEASNALVRIGNLNGRLSLEDMLAKKESPSFIKPREFLKVIRRVLEGKA